MDKSDSANGKNMHFYLKIFVGVGVGASANRLILRHFLPLNILTETLGIIVFGVLTIILYEFLLELL